MPKDYDKVKKSLLSEYATENLLPLDSYNKTSKEKVLWFCKHCSENYPAQIRKRVYEASGCPRCARKRSSIPLSKEFPSLLKDYDTKKNAKHLDYYSKGSMEKVWWKCHICSDEKKRSINSRASRGHGCKICWARKEVQRRNKIKISEEGSLLEKAPHIAKEWDYKKNKLGPEDYTYKSGESVFWICAYGHTWKTSINDRVKNNSGCRKCGNQNSQYEMRLYSELSIFDDDVRWNERIEGIECDIYLPSIKLAIEVDGFPWHDSDESRIRDIKKSKKLKLLGISSIRYRDSQLEKLTKSDVSYVHQEDQFPSFIKLLKKITDHSNDKNFNKKITTYLSKQNQFVNEDLFQKLYLSSGKKIFRKSLEDEYPDIASEWSNKNYPLKPSEVYSRGKKIVWWDCPKCGNAYPKMVKERTRQDRKGSGCPCGSTSVVNNENNLLITRGTGVKSWWDFKTNKKTPDQYRPNSREEVWFICPEGHRFKNKIVKVWGDKRDKNIRCQFCKKMFPKEI